MLSRKLRRVVTVTTATAFAAVVAVFVLQPPAITSEALMALGTLLALGLFSTLLDFRITEGRKEQRAARWRLVRLTPRSEPEGAAGTSPGDESTDLL